MNAFKKSVLAIATVSVIAVSAAAPANAGNKWKKPFAQGLGFGVGLGIAGAIFQPRPQTVYVGQPVYRTTCRQVPAYNGWGQMIGYQTVC